MKQYCFQSLGAERHEASVKAVREYVARQVRRESDSCGDSTSTSVRVVANDNDGKARALTSHAVTLLNIGQPSIDIAVA